MCREKRTVLLKDAAISTTPRSTKDVNLTKMNRFSPKSRCSPTSRFSPTARSREKQTVLLKDATIAETKHTAKEDTRGALTIPQLVLACLIEHACIIVPALLRSKLPLGSQESFPHFFLWTVMSQFNTEVVMCATYVLAKTLYRDVPYFAGKETHRPTLSTVAAWLKCNLVVHIVGSCIAWNIISGLSAKQYHTDRPFHLATFCVNFIVVRLFTDVIFYCLHRMLHTRWFYWIHKKHHQHHSCNSISTNTQFSALDLFFEGLVPVLSAMLLAEALGCDLDSKLEKNLLSNAMLWYEVGSHAGKELPIVSYCPPVAPLTRYFGLERRNVAFHEDHHKFTHCNYGITQWIDCVLGTVRSASADGAN